MSIDHFNDTVAAAEKAFIGLAAFSAGLMSLAAFLDTRYLSDGSPKSEYSRRELTTTVTDIGSLISILAVAVGTWKKDGRRLLSRNGLEVNVIDELFINLRALMYLLCTYQIDISVADPDSGFVCLDHLKRCNRQLP